MKTLLHLVMLVVLTSASPAQIRVSEQVRKDLQATIESKAARAAEGISVIDKPHHVRLLGTTIAFDKSEDGLSAQIGFDREGAPPGFRICWRSVKDGVEFDNELMVDSSGRFEYAIINGLEFDPTMRAKPVQNVEPVSTAEPAPPRAMLVDSETGELEPTELTQLMISKEFARLKTEIERRIKDAPVRPQERAEAPQKAKKKK